MRESPSGEFKGMKILIVEDAIVNLHVLRSALDSLGLKVHIAPDGDTALQLARRVVPDLILLDITLPGAMNGYEVCEKLKLDELTCDIPVIFISALNDMENILKGFSVGGSDYIVKPFHFEEAFMRVRNQLHIRHLHKEQQSLISRLADSEKRYRTIVEKVPEIIFQLDPEKKITFANSSFRFMGYDTKDLIGLPVEQFMESDDMENQIYDLATKLVGPLAMTDLEITFKVNRDSSIFEEVKKRKFLVDAVGLWNVSDEDVFKGEVDKTFLGTLCIGRAIT